MIRALLLLVTVAACGLLPAADDLDFRSYPLPDVPFAAACELVPAVTRDFYRERFTSLGGFSIDWDEATGQLRASPITAGARRMRLYAVLSPAGAGSNLDLFALVETMADADLGGATWGRPQKDVHLEEQLYAAVLQAWLARR